MTTIDPRQPPRLPLPADLREATERMAFAVVPGAPPAGLKGSVSDALAALTEHTEAIDDAIVEPLRRRPDAAAVIGRLDIEHVELATQLRRVNDRLATVEQECPEPLATLVAAEVSAFQAALDSHLEHEQTVVVSMLADAHPLPAPPGMPIAPD